MTPETMTPAAAGDTRPASATVLIPGEICSPAREIELTPGRTRRRLRVTSTSARPIRVSSHYPFWRANPRLEFDRREAAGFRLDIPAGTSIRWAPGEVREVGLVAIGYGERRGPASGGQS